MFACYGWGHALVRWTAIRDKDDFAFLSVVGIACLIFLGGVLNLFRLAYPAALIILLLIGLAFFFIRSSANAKTWLASWRSGSLIDQKKLKSGYALPIGILAIAVGFYALTLLPAAAFNYGDDFLTYIPRPLRMLQTGTMVGDPFELFSVDLGAQAFLHGFVLLGFPIEYLQGFDAVFSFALAGMLLIAIGNKFKLHWSYTAFALIGFIVINPQSVNISALYTGSAIILGILFASCHLLDQINKSGSDAVPIISVVILGLLLAGAIAVKTSFASYVFAYFALFFTGLILISKDKRNHLKIGGFILLSTFVALLPWLALHATNYVSTIHAVLHPSTVAVKSENAHPIRNIIPIFSANDLFYGSSYLSYGIILLMLFTLGSYSLLNAYSNKVTPTQRGYFLVAAASCAAGVASYFFNDFYTVPESAVRYSCPVLIAALPFSWLASSMTTSNTAHPAKLLKLFGVKTAIMLSMSLLVVTLFFNNFMSRIERAYYRHITLSFPISDRFIELIRYTTSPDAKQKIREIQYLTQPMQKILAWIDMPGDLDFARNEIYAVGPQGLRNPWIDIPFNENVDDIVQYLRGQGIRYIMWEYSDNYGRVATYQRWNAIGNRAGLKALYFRRMLALIMNGGSFLYNANGIVLFDLQQVK